MKWTLATTGTVSAVAGVMALPIVALIIILMLGFCGCGNTSAEIEKWSSDLGDEVLHKLSRGTEEISGLYVIGVPQLNTVTGMYETVFCARDPRAPGHVVTGYRAAISPLPPRIEDDKMDVIVRCFYQDDNPTDYVYFAK